MQRKCNLSLYTSKRRVITRCLHCNARLQNPSPLPLFCSDNCLQESQLTQPTQEHRSAGIRRRSQIVIDEDNWNLDQDESADDSSWLKQSHHWIEESGPQFEHRRLTRVGGPTQKPLVLTGHGARLRIERGSLFVENGFTHYPQAREKWRFFPADPDLPSRIILIDTSGYLTVDVLHWLSMQSIPLLALDWKGHVSTVLGVGPADLELRNAQLAAMKNGRGFRLAIELVKAKLRGSQRTLNTLPITSRVEAAISTLESNLSELRREIPDVATLMLIEARAACSYFQAWRDIPLTWKGASRHPIPPQWHLIGSRPSFVSGGNRHATHPVNALLNYAYRVLESQMHIAIVASGLDPTIGFLHANRDGRAALVYDLMESLRPEVDRSILRFATSTTFTPKDFLLTREGKCRLHPQLARRVVGLNLKDQIIDDTVRKAMSVLVRKYD